MIIKYEKLYILIKLYKNLKKYKNYIKLYILVAQRWDHQLIIEIICNF